MIALTMDRFILVCICLAGEFFVFSLSLEDALTLGSKNVPRFLTKNSTRTVFEYKENQTVFFYKEDSAELYVGGIDFVLRLNTSDYHVLETFNLTTTGPQDCPKAPCQNVVTVIEELNGSVFVCGTNGYQPQCWTLDSALKKRSEESYDGTGISPFESSQNAISLTVEGDLYAAAPLESDGSSLQFRRIVGKRTKVWMHGDWLLEPTFISASWVKRENDSINDKIYMFFREKNSDTSPEAEHWISRVARVCKVDEGGSKRFFQNKWTSFVKARLVCGFQEESLYFNRLQDIFVLHDSNNWNNTRVYAIFTSSWNSTAVCIYTIGMIENVFENSTFKGYDGDIPSPRPGTCVPNSRSLPLATVSIVKDHPEMADWVHSVHSKAPFYVSSYNYTKIVVDRVQGADNKLHNVLLLTTDSGKVHKVLETDTKPFLISETRLTDCSGVLSVKLDSKKKTLLVGFSNTIKTVDLKKCEYTSCCQDCVLAQDPYCAWSQDTRQCTETNGTIQNVITGIPSVCQSQEDEKLRRKRQTFWSPGLSTEVHSVPLNMPFYLSCPIDSYHAEYSWKHGDQLSPCLQMKSDCLHLIPAMAQHHYGNYQCVSQEKGYSKVVKQYRISIQNLTKADRPVKSPSLNNAGRPVTQAVWLTTGLLLTML